MTFWLWIESLLCSTVFSLTFSILGSEIKVQNWGLFWTWGEQRCDVSIFSCVLRKRNLNLAKRITFLRLRKKNACVEHAFSEMLSYDQLCVLWASPVAQMVKNPPAMWETWVQSLGWRRARQPTPVFLPGESHGQRSLVGYVWSMGSQRVGHNLATEHAAYMCPALF